MSKLDQFEGSELSVDVLDEVAGGVWSWGGLSVRNNRVNVLSQNIVTNQTVIGLGNQVLSQNSITGVIVGG